MSKTNKQPPEQPDVSQKQLKSMPLHGGDINAAAEYFSIDKDQWIDLSTGMNPAPYPIPDIPDACFHRLPYINNDFIAAVNNYYHNHSFVALPGSQSGIQLLPKLLDSNIPVLLPNIGYKEHEQVWREHQAQCYLYNALNEVSMCEDIDKCLHKNSRQHLVIIQPNNPTSVLVSQQQLLQWSEMMDDDAYLMIDEAFIDTSPQKSFLSFSTIPNNVIVLRSFGKFFGLAGIRLGFMFANASLLSRATAMIGLWQVNGPAQYIATQALNNKQWQCTAIDKISIDAETTVATFSPLAQLFNMQLLSKGLFLSYETSMPVALALYHALAQQGILTRVIDVSQSTAIFRLGLIDHHNQDQIQRVFLAIKNIVNNRELKSLVVDR